VSQWRQRRHSRARIERFAVEARAARAVTRETRVARAENRRARVVRRARDKLTLIARARHTLGMRGNP